MAAPPPQMVHSKARPWLPASLPQTCLPPPPQAPQASDRPTLKRRRGEESSPGQPPEAPEHKHRRREERSGNHCRYFNFGANACSRADTCKFWRITEDNYDSIENRNIADTDEKRVIAAVITKLRRYFGAKRSRHALQRTSKKSA